MVESGADAWSGTSSVGVAVLKSAGVPQWEQNFCPGSRGVLQCGQKRGDVCDIAAFLSSEISAGTRF